jgi:hypothetical protein
MFMALGLLKTMGYMDVDEVLARSGMAKLG